MLRQHRTQPMRPGSLSGVIVVTDKCRETFLINLYFSPADVIRRLSPSLIVPGPLQLPREPCRLNAAIQIKAGAPIPWYWDRQRRLYEKSSRVANGCRHAEYFVGGLWEQLNKTDDLTDTDSERFHLDNQ